MSSHVGFSCAKGPSRTEGAGEENANGKTYSPCLKAVRQRVRSVDAAGEGRSGGAEHLERPALPGWRAHRKSLGKENRGRWRDGDRDTDEERLCAEQTAGPERAKQRLRKTERPGEGSQARYGRGATQSSAAMEAGDDTYVQQLQTRSQGSCSTSSIGSNPQPPWLAAASASTAAAHLLPTQTRPSAPPSPRAPPRTSCRDLHRCTGASAREQDPFWAEVRATLASGASTPGRQTLVPSPTGSELGEEEEEEEEGEEDGGEEGGSGAAAVVMTQRAASAAAQACFPHEEERKAGRRERNRIKYLRRRQRRRERWRQSQLQESRQSSPRSPSSSDSSGDDEEVVPWDREGYICAVCLDVYFSPYMCHPCNHIFCEPCLRTLAKNSPANTPCPLCRTTITHVFFQKELNQTTRTFFPKEYLSRKQTFQKASCAKWPLPSCRRLFHIFGSFQRPSTAISRRQYPHGGGYRLDTMDFQDDSQGWRFDMDMVIIYIYSINWIIGFFIFCLLCYLFFPSF